MARKISAAAKVVNNTTKQTLYTVPTKNTGLWSLMYLIVTAGNETPEVYWYDYSASVTAGSDVEYYILGGKNIGPGEYVMLNQAEVALQEGDEIRVKNHVNPSTVTYIATVELVPNMATQFHGG